MIELSEGRVVKLLLLSPKEAKGEHSITSRRRWPIGPLKDVNLTIGPHVYLVSLVVYRRIKKVSL